MVIICMVIIIMVIIIMVTIIVVIIIVVIIRKVSDPIFKINVHRIHPVKIE